MKEGCFVYNKSEFFCAPNVSKKALNRFYAHFSAEKEELHALEVYEGGKLLIRSASVPYSTTDKRECYSISKSFTATAIGMLITEGKLSEDDRIVDIFPDRCPPVISENLAALRVRHVLSMNMGQTDWECLMPQMTFADDAAEAFLAQDFPLEPGTCFAYNTGGSCLLAAIVQHISGMTLLDYLNIKLFAPLGINGVNWVCVNDGTNAGGLGIQLCVGDMAKLGLLYLNGGVWMGKRLLSEEWVKAASSPISDNNQNEDDKMDWRSGYGYQFWINARDGYRCDGASGQYCLILPKYNMVFAIQTLLRDMPAEIDAIFDFIEHIHDADDACDIPVLLPDYTPPRSMTRITGMENRVYRLEENPLRFTTFSLSYDTAKDALLLNFSNGEYTDTVTAGNGRYFESTLTAPYFLPRMDNLIDRRHVEMCRIASSYRIIDGEVHWLARLLNCPNPVHVKIAFSDEAVTIRIEPDELVVYDATVIKGTLQN